MSEPVIEVDGLMKRFGSLVALDGLDLKVERGEIHGFLGPNGSGKTTTIRILLGLARADGGDARVFERDPWQDPTALHRRLSYVPGEVDLWPNMTGGEIIDLLVRLRGRLDRAKRDELVERFRLDPTRRARTYSKGNRQKVLLIAALASDVELFLLDEPTSGLDPLMEQQCRELLARECRDNGRTVLLSSHILSEVDALCDRVTIIRDGRTVESGALAQLRGLGSTVIAAEVTSGGDVLAAELRRLPGVKGVTVEVDTVRVEVASAGLPAVLGRLGDADVTGLTSAGPSLEDLFLRHYRATAPAGGGSP